MRYFNCNKLLWSLSLMTLLSGALNVWAADDQDAAMLRLATPVVDGSLPPDIVAIQNRGVLREALYVKPIPPFSILDSKGHWSGLNVMLGQRIAQGLGVKLQIVPATSYDDLANLITSGQADIAMGLSILPTRQIKVSFSNSYYTYHPHLLVNRLAALHYGWKTPEQVMIGLETTTLPIKIGVFGGNEAASLIQQSFPHTQAVPYEDYQQGFQDVLEGKIFAMIGATPAIVKGFLQSNPQATLHGEDVEISNLQDMLGVALPWQDFHLRQWLNTYINYLGREQIAQEFSQ
jgi:polar amino acid transport system substrate-binding protein